MECLCEQKETQELKIEGDVEAEPVWCNQCGCNLDMEGLQISNDLKKALMEWIKAYGAWMDWEQDTLLINGIELEEVHNKQGMKLTGQVKNQVGRGYEITFSASVMAKEVYKA